MSVVQSGELTAGLMADNLDEQMVENWAGRMAAHWAGQLEKRMVEYLAVTSAD